jgi:hypothetical protein
MVWVRERTIPTERPPLVAEVIANFCGGQRDGSLRPYSRFYTQVPLLFCQVASQLYSRGWVDPFPDPLLFSGSAGNRTLASGSVAKNIYLHSTNYLEKVFVNACEHCLLSLDNNSQFPQCSSVPVVMYSYFATQTHCTVPNPRNYM